MTDQRQLQAAYRHCLELARSHYENFPVASRLLPARLRRPIAVIYAFARRADDFADEGQLEVAQRLELLDQWQAMLDAVQQGARPDEPVFIALADVVQHHRLPWTLFSDLLSAFRQDVTQQRYDDFAEVLDYCRRSANPVGRLLLHLNQTADDEKLRRSDRLCSALQLINFLQDIQQDYTENGRIYLPQEDMQRFAISSEDIKARRDDAAMRALLQYQIERIRALLKEGAPLAWTLKGRLGLELRMTVSGAWRILQKLEQAGSCYARPRLRGSDWLWMLGRSLALRPAS
ncbi:MAG: squalene synthase HpnC [Gammaproteobacteria bacterium]